MSALVSLCFSLSLTDGTPAGAEEEGPEGQGQGEGKGERRRERKTVKATLNREQRASARQLGGGGVVGATAGAGDQYSI